MNSPGPVPTLISGQYIYCWLQVDTINRERLLSEKQNNKASAEARLPKEAMLLRDIYKAICGHMYSNI